MLLYFFYFKSSRIRTISWRSRLTTLVIKQLWDVKEPTHYCPFQKRAGEWGEFRPAKASGIGTRDRVSCLQKKRSEFELFTQIFFYILLKCQSITAVCLDSPTAIEISLLDLSFIACQRT